jgi:hypothetical protein
MSMRTVRSGRSLDASTDASRVVDETVPVQAGEKTKVRASIARRIMAA